MSTEGERTWADAPFDDVDADVIICSQNGIQFRVFKIFLSYASPVFKAMFTLPEGQGTPTVDVSQEVPVAEDSLTLDLLLRYCYPVSLDEPEPAGLGTLVLVLKAAIKYDMRGVERRVRAALPRFAAEEPMRLYALALANDLEEVTRLAAKETLRLPLLGRTYIPELESITAGAHHRLQEYHIRCASIAGQVARNFDWVTQENSIWFECTECRGQGHRDSTNIAISGGRRKWVTSKWWLDYLTQAAAVLADKPSGASVTDIDLLDEVLGKAASCPTCRLRAPKELRCFSRAFAAEVDRATATVELQVLLR